MPPWLTRTPDLGANFTRGLQIGANIAQERNRLAQQAEQAAMSAAIRAQEIEQDSIRKQQELLMEKAYKDAMVGLRKRELDTSEATFQMKAQQAARRFASQQTFQRRVQAGEDPAQVLLEMGPALGESLTGAAQLYKATRPMGEMPAPAVEEYAGQKFLKIPERTGEYRMQQIRQAPSIAEGPVKAQSILDPITGKPIKGMVATPTATGGYTTHIVPDRQMRIATARINELEKGVFGLYLTQDTEPPQRKGEAKDAYQKRLATFRKAKLEYDRMKQIVEGLDADETPRGRVARPPVPAGRVRVIDPQGVPGTNPEGQLDDAIAAGWQEAD